jgi:hypothetical protein
LRAACPATFPSNNRYNKRSKDLSNEVKEKEMSDNQPVVVQAEPVATAPQTSGKAIVSLIFGIACFILPLALISSIVAVAVGYSARKDIRRSAGALKGEDMATAGIILGWVFIGLSVIGICLVVVIALGLFGAIGSMGFNSF